MKVRVYQIPPDVPAARYMFCGYEIMLKNLGRIPFEEYSLVYEGDVRVQTLERLFIRFNADDRPNATSMRSLSVSDIVEIVEADPAMYSPGLYFCDSVGFKKLTNEDTALNDINVYYVPANDIAMKLYRRYQLHWMMSQDYTLARLFRELQYAIADYEGAPCDLDLEAEFENAGFGGSIWVCFDEFMGSEFRDKEFMLSMCKTDEERQKYLDDLKNYVKENKV